MAQQINLCSPILLTQKKYFSAATMAASLVLFAVAGAALAGAWVWNLGRAENGFRATLESQATEKAGLQAALDRAKAAALPPDAALAAHLEATRQQLAQRRALLAALQTGVLPPEQAHSARLRFLAQSTPMSAWVTGVTVSGDLFEVSGNTLDPAALNDWVARMATQPTLQGLQLTRVAVLAQGSDAKGAAITAQAAASAASAPGRKQWSFVLGSTRSVPPPASGPQSAAAEAVR